MKPATLAPMYATLLPPLSEAARSVGYALAVHGSMSRDLDVVAVPWTDEAADPRTLIAALMAICGGDLGRVNGAGKRVDLPEAKPHGRLAWVIFLPGGEAYIDLSVMPRVNRAEGT
jgi:hypothetical protein